MIGKQNRMEKVVLDQNSMATITHDAECIRAVLPGGEKKDGKLFQVRAGDRLWYVADDVVSGRQGTATLARQDAEKRTIFVTIWRFPANAGQMELYFHVKRLPPAASPRIGKRAIEL